MIKKTIKAIVFTGIGIMLICLVQRILIPVWAYPNYDENVSHTLKDYYELEKDTVDVLFVGTSHMAYGVSPMKIYDKYHLTSYNLGTSAQSLTATFYVLREAFKSQSPKVVMLDVSSFFHDKDDDQMQWWKYWLDVMPISVNKIDAAIEFSDIDSDKRGCLDRAKSVLEVLFPILSYHDRWSEVESKDFLDFLSENTYCTKGYNICSIANESNISVDDMNKMILSLKSNRIEQLSQVEYGMISNTKAISKMTPSTGIPDENIDILRNISDICTQHGSELVLVKIPSISNPADYHSSWTIERHYAAKNFAEQMGLDFIDILYDSAVNIDWRKDTTDAGRHLNCLGAKKVSDYISEILLLEYGIQSRRVPQYDVSLNAYRKISEVAELQVETSLDKWLDKTKKFSDRYTLFCSGYKNFTAGLSIKEINAAKELGLFNSFSVEDVNGNSYIAIIKCGDTIYEGVDNRVFTYEYSDENIKNVMITSNGIEWQTDSIHIFIDNVEECVKQPGLNFVIYDNDAEQVIDSVCFGTHTDEETRWKSHINQSDYLNSFMWRYYKQGWN